MTLIDQLAYKPGWKFKQGGPGGRFLCVFATTQDSLAPERQRTTQHMWGLPALEGRELVRWVFDRLLDAERHEAAEFFQVAGVRPFWPNHQDEGDPYVHVDR